MQDSICEVVRQMEDNYTNGSTTISKYVEFDMAETLNKIDAYINSVHTSGAEDSLGRDKPFFNIVTAARNIWYRATDIDRKHIRLKPKELSQYLLTFVAQMLLNNWMKQAGFGAVLNEWGKNLATYGSAVLKFVRKNGELKCSNIPWNRIICDAIDFDNNLKVEVLEFTPAQLRKQKGYDQEVVMQLLEDLAPREDLNRQKKDSKAEYIKVYEVHGELPLSHLTEDEKDEDTYVQQMHVVCFTAKKGRRGKSEYQDYTLYKGREAKDPYMITHLIKEDGRTLGIGAVEHLFEAQWMVNHTAKQTKDTLDFASLLILQTADGSLVGRNVLQSLITGDILVYDRSQDPDGVKQVNNAHDITQIQAFGAQWQNLAKEITATPDAIRGNTQPSGTAYRLQQLITNEAHSLFEVMTENKGLAIEAMLREYIIPFLKTQMDTREEISAVLEGSAIAEFDSIYIPKEAMRRNNERIKNEILSGQIADQGDVQALQEQVRNELAPLGNHRFIKPSDVKNTTWKQLLEGFEWEPDVDVTHESVDTDAILTTLSTALQTVAANPMVLHDPAMKALFVRILEQTGAMSAIEIPNSPMPQLQVPPTGGASSPASNMQPMMAQPKL